MPSGAGAGSIGGCSFFLASRVQPGPAFRAADRAFLAALSRIRPRRGQHWLVVTLAPRAHTAELDAAAADRGPGPPVERRVRGLLRLTRENARWAYRRIAGELLELGVRLSPSTVRAAPAGGRLDARAAAQRDQAGKSFYASRWQASWRATASPPPAASAAASDQPSSSTRSASSRLERGHVLALLCNVTVRPPWSR
jgi:hypothetical protein